MINHVDHVEQIERLKALASEVGQIAYGVHEYFGTGLLEKRHARKVCGWHMEGENYCGNLLWQSYLIPSTSTWAPEVAKYGIILVVKNRNNLDF